MGSVVPALFVPPVIPRYLPTLCVVQRTFLVAALAATGSARALCCDHPYRSEDCIAAEHRRFQACPLAFLWTPRVLQDVQRPSVQGFAV